MSLQVDDGGRRGRSRSPAGRRADEDRDTSRTHVSPNVVEATPYPSSSDAYRNPSSTAYEYERLSKWPTAAHDDDSDDDRGPEYYRGAPPRGKPTDSRGDVYTENRETRREVDYRYEADRRRDQDSGSDRDKGGRQRSDSDVRRRAEMYLPSKYAGGAHVKTVEPQSPRQSRDSLRDRDRDWDRDRDSDKERERRLKKEKLEEDLAYGKLPAAPSKYDRAESPPAAATYAYAQPKQWEYAKPPEEPRYSATHLDALGPGRRPAGRSPSPGPPSPIKSAMKRDRSPQPPTARMSTLTVNTPHHNASLSVSAAPASPLLEAYHGTYQSMSPMPSPMLLPTGGPGGSHPQILEALSPIGSDDERAGDRRRARRARFNDPADDAARLAKALKGEKRAPETEALIEILPGLTHDQVMELRVEYKRLVKTGTERKGVNIAKHIRARLKDEDPFLMKACYATALGRWESEAYWANFWYHGDKTRRELLIESLMGRTNDEIRRIKEGFSDKKYANSLSKCMRTELKEDKFKKAVLLVLEEQRMEEEDSHGRPARIDYDLVDDDVRQLHHAVRADKGGESLMISIVTQRSDTHLREVLREYKVKYKGANFAKDALKKSGNLVGEVLAHILNGIINKPVRDAMLLHHALAAPSSRKRSADDDDLRRDLLISRLVRYHWDPAHMALVRRSFREQYGVDLQDAVRDATAGTGEFGAFCVALSIARTPDDVRRVERVDIHRR